MKIPNCHPETCVQREQDQACLSYAERQQVRQSQLVSGSVLLSLVLALCTLTGCGSLNQATQLVHDIHQDSTYHQHIRYDSIYIYQSHEKDYRKGHPEPPVRHPELVSGSAPDTVVIKDISIEYRYKLLRDTIHIIQRDSIPYPVTVVETREVRYTPWWSKALSWVGAICLVLVVGKLLIKRFRLFG